MEMLRVPYGWFQVRVITQHKDPVQYVLMSHFM